MHRQPTSWNLQLCGRGPRSRDEKRKDYYFCHLGFPECTAEVLRSEVLHSRPQARMGLRHLLQIMLLLALAVPRSKASGHCSPLQYWNPDSKRCSSCLQRFGPPPYPDHEFEENCGLSDFGDHLTHPFKKCSPGHCNPDFAELCSPCTVEAPVPIRTGSPGRTQQCCGEESTSPGSSSLSWTTQSSFSHFVLPLVLVLSLMLAMLTCGLLLQRHHQKGKAHSPLCPGLVHGDNTPTLSLHSPFSPGIMETEGTGKALLLPLQSMGELGRHTQKGRGVLEACPSSPSFLPVPELAGLVAQPLSRLLDELEVLEELIVLLDPEPGPGPGGGMAYGTTRHLAARYGLPAAWSTFAYSLRPTRSPLRALIEMVVAREPSATLGELSVHLAHLRRNDALQVLSRLG
ncbi:IGF-like family receptor 1 isoform X2 [Fukomys damarensis]|uniref:IGF-like family receptor 1 isoform X2 n=1 Tax=Fukomys damarensis TaxID=885580 RepID=UPI00053FB4C4|nr:IGF-like family receptor 1 isoform X2 [Fukomys damarensis]XP_010630144.1 IGF-like family receptor 1 isoform X2 [Fukomys damarensis]